MGIRATVQTKNLTTVGLGCAPLFSVQVPGSNPTRLLKESHEAPNELAPPISYEFEEETGLTIKPLIKCKT